MADTTYLLHIIVVILKESGRERVAIYLACGEGEIFPLGGAYPLHSRLRPNMFVTTASSGKHLTHDNKQTEQQKKKTLVHLAQHNNMSEANIARNYFFTKHFSQNTRIIGTNLFVKKRARKKSGLRYTIRLRVNTANVVGMPPSVFAPTGVLVPNRS